jgi:hypothetical protein
VSLSEEAIEVLHGSKDWIDAAIIGDVISEIGHGRSINWCHPNSINPEFHQIVEPLNNTSQVSDAGSVGVLKGPGINLVYYRGLPTK